MYAKLLVKGPDAVRALDRVCGAVMDFALPELGNLMIGSVINGGKDRLLSAGRMGIPQIVAPGCLDLIDFAGWQEIPERFSDRPFHAHNRLIKSSALNAAERRETARGVNARLSQAKAPVQVILPTAGIEEWDRPGQEAHEPEALAEFLDEMRSAIKPPVQMSEVGAHINDPAFADAALAVLDAWIANGTINTRVL